MWISGDAARRRPRPGGRHGGRHASALQPANTPGRVTSHGNAATRKCFESVRQRFQTQLEWQLVAANAQQQRLGASTQPLERVL